MDTFKNGSAGAVHNMMKSYALTVAVEFFRNHREFIPTNQSLEGFATQFVNISFEYDSELFDGQNLRIIIKENVPTFWSEV